MFLFIVIILSAFPLILYILLELKFFQECNTWCAIFCNNFECCNVATCQFNEKMCKVGYYGKAHKEIPIYDPNAGGKLFLVKETGLWQTSMNYN